MTIIELRAKRATAWEAAKAFAESHTTANGTLSAEDNATYEKMEQEIADLGREIQRRERQDALDAELNKPVNQPITNNPANAEKPKSGRAERLTNTRRISADTFAAKSLSTMFSPRALTRTAVTSYRRNSRIRSSEALTKRTSSVPSPRSSPLPTTERFPLLSVTR